MSGLRSGSSRFTAENRQATIDLQASYRQAAAARRQERNNSSGTAGNPALEPHSTGTTPQVSRANTPPPPEDPPGPPPDPIMATNFEDENGTDDARAMQDACKNLSSFAFNQEDLPFYFQQIEAKMGAVGVKKNFTKFQVLSTIIPPHVMNEVKPLLRLQATDFPENDAYKQLKQRIM